MKKTLPFAVAMLLALPTLFAQSTQGVNIDLPDGHTMVFVISGDEATLSTSSPSGSMEANLGDVQLPDSIEYEGTKYPITAIGIGAFRRAQLTSITLPNTLKVIDSSAFRYCTGLEEIVMPNSVVRIGAHCFNNCTALRSVTLSTALTNIPHHAFFACHIESLVVPDAVATIEDYAFNENEGMTDLTLGSGVQSIGLQAFLPVDGRSQLDVLRVRAEQVPHLSSSVFTVSQNTTTTVYVPCGKATDYSADDAWARFSRIREDCGGSETPDNPTDDPHSGIATAEALGATIATNAGSIVVGCQQARTIGIYTADGRCIVAPHTATTATAQVPTAGIYVVTIDGTATKVTVLP